MIVNKLIDRETFKSLMEMYKRQGIRVTDKFLDEKFVSYVSEGVQYIYVDDIKDFPVKLLNNLDEGIINMNEGMSLHSKEYNFEILSIGRKWIKGKDLKTGYTNNIEKNEITTEWKVGDRVTFLAYSNFDSNRYGTTVTIHPATGNNKPKASREEIIRWLKYVEDKAGEYVYQNGVDRLKELGISDHPDLNDRMNAAIKKTQDVINSKKEEKKNKEIAFLSQDKVYLDVPYSDKDYARAHGAKWDATKKKWYVLGGVVPKELEKYLSGTVKKIEMQPGERLISQGEGYGGFPFKVGDVILDPKGTGYVKILKSWERYFKYDGMSFGVGDDRGYIYSAIVRDATDDESLPLRDKEEKNALAKKDKKEIANIGQKIKDTGERIDKDNPVGKTFFSTRNIYGGGEEFIIGKEHIWYVMGNGGDGDNWSYNNIPGAIAWRIPYDKEIANKIESASKSLEGK